MVYCTLGMTSGLAKIHLTAWHDLSFNMMSFYCKLFWTLCRYCRGIHCAQEMSKWFKVRQHGGFCLLGDCTCLCEEPFQMVRPWVYLNHCFPLKHQARRGIWHPWQSEGLMNTAWQLEAQIKHTKSCSCVYSTLHVTIDKSDSIKYLLSSFISYPIIRMFFDNKQEIPMSNSHIFAFLDYK